MAEQDQKREVILEAALKRFSRYGLAKTTMGEIAGDLDMSKGSLYYYFPDKDRIYVAVIERIVSRCFADVSSFLEGPVTVQLVMDRYLTLKEKILQEYHFLFGVHEWVREKPGNLQRQVGELVQQAESRFLAAWIRKGIADGEISPQHDPEKTAEMLVHVLFGLWVIWCKWQAQGFELHHTENIKEFMHREKMVLTIFFNGLR
ncbi:TetR/AcrR family transcriptional regulator [Chitinophaga sp. XS-30]|uniref:TetR/AcrR family transcriptional regulator n=1 Tax=Chitinophaga sp. XS-30 TaxID=2604421 RepID=UPI0011DDD7DA|nr:TetR/AcrR family transcriptional regulator [Chitinophaga sp. XS-30]QEH39848.1 TetR/AcrR family transcriptional regulator [Chitinophaga sp. XS-30]